MSSSSRNFYSSEDIEKKNSETKTDEEDEMQNYEKRILQWNLEVEKIIPSDLKCWSFFHLLKPEFISQIHMICDTRIHGIIIVTKDKNVYNLDDKKEHLNIEDLHTALYLGKIKELCGKNIKTFAHSDKFILALTEEGQVYFCEIPEGKTSKTFIRVNYLKNKRIVDIACGKLHGLALTSDGKVYAWGMINWDDIKVYDIIDERDDRNWVLNESDDNDWKEKNGPIDKENKTHFIPRQVKHGLEKKKVVSIACGDEFNIVVTDENTIYGWGCNDCGQIFIVRPQDYYRHPRRIITILDKIVKVVCGASHTLMLTNKGEVYAWGDNYCGQIGVNNNKPYSEPIVVNLPEMGKVLNVEAYDNMSIAVGYDRSIYIWGNYWYMNRYIIQPFRTKFSRIFDAFVHNNNREWRYTYKPFIVHHSVHTVGIMNNYNYKYAEALNILESLGAAFDDPLTSDFIIQVEGQSIYVHKSILKIRCQYFFNSISDSSSVYTISNKFSYIVYKAFLKYLYTGTIDLPSENALELMELADMHYETNLKKDCSQIIKQTITVSNVKFLYNKAMAYNAKELKEFCFQFVLRHRKANTLSEDYIKLDTSTKANIVHKKLLQNDDITSLTFYSPNKNVEKRSSKTTTKKNEMQKCEKKILQCILEEKIMPMDFKDWPLFHLLTTEFILQIQMLYGNCHSTATIYIVTKDKHVYFYSLNYDKDDFSRINDMHTGSSLKEIKELCGKNIKTIARSDSFILALTEEGEIYFSEIAERYRVTYVSTFIRDINSNEGIVDIACGKYRGCALTRDGKVLVWNDKYWEKNFSEKRDWEESDWKENVLKECDWEENIVHIACGSDFIIAVSDENTIYGWGDNKSGQISIVRQEKYYKYPCEIIKISDKIVKVVCGGYHTLALTNKGEVYAWGDNTRGQIGVNSNEKPTDPIVVNIPEMGKVLDIAAYYYSSIAVGCDKIIYVWGGYHYDCHRSIPFPTKFSNIHDAFAHASVYSRTEHNLSIVFTNNFKYIEEVLNILESLRAIFDDPLTSDLTIRVEERPIYVHKAILKIRCQYFKNMFQHKHNWRENIRSISDSVFPVSDKFSYVVYKAFLKYLYIGIIDLPTENLFELMELADMYCETNLLKNCSQEIKKVITVSNVAFFYNKAIEYNAKELKEFCFHFAVRHMTSVVLSEDFIKLDTSTKDNFMRRAAEGNTFGISFF